MTTNLVLGGEGLIGRSLCSALKKMGENVVSFDIESGFDLRTTVPQDVPQDSYCWFLAWDVGGAKYLQNPARQKSILENNLRICQTVFAWLRETGIPFTFTGSQMAGYPDAYGVTKALGHYTAGLLPSGRIARLWNVYGVEPISEKSHALTDFVAQARTGSIRLMTQGREERQFITARDCARALIAHRESGQRVADIASGEWVSILQMANTVGRLTGAKVIPGRRPGFIRRLEPMDRLRGWAPKESIEIGLTEMIEAMGATQAPALEA